MLIDPIPGATPIDDASGLRVKGITTQRELNPFEAANILKATKKYLGRKPSRLMARFDLTWVQKLHKEMLGDVWKWAGLLRTCNLSIGIDFEKVETELFEMCENLRAQPLTDTWNYVEQSAWLHHRAVFIHPFLNGNGRWSRLLTNIWLKQNGHPIVIWPTELVGEKSPIRDLYLAAIKKANDREYEELEQLHREFSQSHG